MHGGLTWHVPCVQEALKAIPEEVLDAPPPQLDALPAFALPQPLPPPHSTSAHAGIGASTVTAALVPESLAAAGDAPGERSRKQQQQADLACTEDIADVREGTAAPQQAAHAAAACVSASSEDQIAEPKRLRLDSCAAGDVPGAAMAENHSGIAPDDQHQSEGQSSLEQGLQYAQEGGIDDGLALEQHSEQAGKHRPYLEKGRVLVSA